jgi:hypothetical protein
MLFFQGDVIHASLKAQIEVKLRVWVEKYGA